MAFTTATVRVAIPTSGATFDVTSSGFGTMQAVILDACAATADNTATANHRFSWGICDAAGNQRCIGGDSIDAGGDSISDSVLDLTKCIRLIQAGTPTEVGAASFNSVITDGVRFNIDTAFAAAYLLTVTFYKGMTNATVGDVNTGTTVDVAITATVGHPTKLLLTACTKGRTTTGTTASYALALGAVGNGTGGVTQASYSREDLDAQTAMACRSATTNTYGMSIMSNVYQLRAEFGNFTATTFDMTPKIDNPAANTKVIFLALNFTEDVDVSVESCPTTVTTKAYTSLGKRPVFLYTIVSDTHTLDTLDATGQEPSTFGVGVKDSVGEFVTSFRQDDAATTADCDCVSISGDILHTFVESSTSSNQRAGWVSWDATGFTLDHTVVEGTATLFVAVTVAESASELLPKMMHYGLYAGSAA